MDPRDEDSDEGSCHSVGPYSSEDEDIFDIFLPSYKRQVFHKGIKKPKAKPVFKMWFPYYNGDKPQPDSWHGRQNFGMAEFATRGQVRPQYEAVGVQKRTRQVNLRKVLFTTHPHEEEVNKYKPNPILFTFLDTGRIYGRNKHFLPNAVWIDTPDRLSRLITKLQGLDQFFFDTEAHATDTRNGFTCVIQVSTMDRDFLVDAIALQKQIGPAFKPILEAHSPLKILHAAANDILNLQRDYDIYMAGIFDVQLLYQVVNGKDPIKFYNMIAAFYEEYTFLIHKSQQKSDWRRRPLLEEQKRYATNDTHLLLHVYNLMKQICLQHGEDGKAILQRVYTLSQKMTLKLFVNREDPVHAIDYEKMMDSIKEKWQNEELEFHKDTYLQQLIQSLSEKSTKTFICLLEWRHRFCLLVDKKDDKLVSDEVLLNLSLKAPTTEIGFRKICLTQMLLEQEAKQIKVVLRLLVEGEKYLDELRHVKCNNCFDEGHPPKLCPYEKIPGNYKKYMNMPEHRHYKQRAGQRRFQKWLGNVQKRDEEEKKQLEQAMLGNQNFNWAKGFRQQEALRQKNPLLFARK